MDKTSNHSVTLAQILKGDRTSVPALDLVRDNPTAAAVISKLVAANNVTTEYDQGGKRRPSTSYTNDFRNQSNRTAQNISDNRTVLQILPDLKHGANIITNCILSPNDMLTLELNYSLPDDLVPSQVSGLVVKKLRDYFEQDYKIKPLLSKILRQSLIEAGSYPVAVLPENAIDDVINNFGSKVTMESLKESFDENGTARPRGILGPAKAITPTRARTGAGLGVESIDYQVRSQILRKRDSYAAESMVTLELEFSNAVETHISVSDNFDLLKIPLLNQKIREGQVMESIGSRALESISIDLSDRAIDRRIYRNQRPTYNPLTIVKTQDQLNRRSVGEPVIQHFPPESVLPAFVPGSPDRRIGVFVLLDGEGYPLNTSKNSDYYYTQLQSRLNSTGSFASAMIQKAGSNIEGFDWHNPDHYNHATKLFGVMMERELTNRLVNGVYGPGVKVGGPQDVYMMMMARSLMQERTQILYIPGELVTYFSFDYNDNGTGKSLLDDLRIVNSMRCMLAFANLMAGVKNSIGRTEVKLKFDPDDPNPMKTMETAIHEIARSRQQGLPLGNNSPIDLTDWVVNAGMEFTWEGHPGMPDVGVEFGEKASNYVKPDTDLTDSLRRQSLMGMGLPPELVDNAFNPEFATQVLTNNIMLTKQVILWQEAFTPQLANHLRQVVMHSENFVGELRTLLRNNIDSILRSMERREKLDAQAANRSADGQMGGALKGIQEVDPESGESVEVGKKTEETKQANAEKTPEELREEDRKINLIINDVLYRIITSFEVNLPKPSSVSLENLMKEFQTYSDAFDKILDTYINSEMLNDTVAGNLAGGVETIKAAVKNTYLRRFISDAGILPEIAELVQTDDEGNPKVNILQATVTHLRSLVGSLSTFLQGVDPTKVAANIFAEKGLESGQPAGGGASPFDNAGGGDNTDTGNGDDAGGAGDDPFGSGDDDPFSSMNDAMGGLGGGEDDGKKKDDTGKENDQSGSDDTPEKPAE